jgi:hypothetical protein
MNHYKEDTVFGEKEKQKRDSMLLQLPPFKLVWLSKNSYFKNEVIEKIKSQPTLDSKIGIFSEFVLQAWLSKSPYYKDVNTLIAPKSIFDYYNKDKNIVTKTNEYESDGVLQYGDQNYMIEMKSSLEFEVPTKLNADRMMKQRSRHNSLGLPTFFIITVLPELNNHIETISRDFNYSGAKYSEKVEFANIFNPIENAPVSYFHLSTIKPEQYKYVQVENAYIFVNLIDVFRLASERNLFDEKFLNSLKMECIRHQAKQNTSKGIQMMHNLFDRPYSEN